MKVRLLLRNEQTLELELESSEHGDSFSAFVVNAMRYGVWMNSKRTDWISPSAIERAWLV